MRGVILILMVCLSETVFSQSKKEKDSLFRHYSREAYHVFTESGFDTPQKEWKVLYNEALYYYNRALEVYPNDTITLYNKAIMFSMFGNYDSSFAIHKRIEPHLIKIGACASLGEDYYFLGDTLTAMKYFEMALSWYKEKLQEITDSGFYGGHEYYGMIYSKSRLLLLLGRKEEVQSLLSHIVDERTLEGVRKMLGMTKAELLRDM